MFRKILSFLCITQEVSNIERENNNNKRLGRGFSKAHRLNPFNPLSYIAVIVIVIAGVIMFGLIGFWKEIKLNNPFEWE